MAKSKAALAREAIEGLSGIGETFEDEIEVTEDPALESNNFLNEDLLSHAKVKTTLVGTLTELGKSTSKVLLPTTNEMIVDEFGLIHNGFIFGAAEYAAVASINQPNVVVIGCRSKFFAPAKLGDNVEFEAKGRYEDARKREIKVIGRINDVKVFEGIFHAVLLENHILKTKIDELQSNFNPKDL